MSRNSLVISANGGVGKATAKLLVKRGYSVWATVSRASRLDEFVTEIPNCEKVVVLDLGDADVIASALKSLRDEMPSLDGVVVCGAISPFAPAEFTAIDTFRRTMEINCTSHLAIYQAVMPALRQSRGSLVLISSLSGRVATPMMASYCASKFALEGLADVLRREASPQGVDVVLVQPGTIDTPSVPQARHTIATAMAALTGDEAMLYGDLYSKTLARVEQALESGAMLPATQVADVVVEALESNAPQARYRVGSDAQALIAMSLTRSDRELDTFLAQAE